MFIKITRRLTEAAVIVLSYYHQPFDLWPSCDTQMIFYLQPANGMLAHRVFNSCIRLALLRPSL